MCNRHTNDSLPLVLLVLVIVVVVVVETQACTVAAMIVTVKTTTNDTPCRNVCTVFMMIVLRLVSFFLLACWLATTIKQLPKL